VRISDAAGSELDRLRLVCANAAPGDGPRWEPGEITSAGTIACGDGTLQIIECQPEGGRPMPLSDYARGHHWQAGLRLRSID
jgi:methionyl-tRNA formyltransferase